MADFAARVTANMFKQMSRIRCRAAFITAFLLSGIGSGIDVADALANMPAELPVDAELQIAPETSPSATKPPECCIHPESNPQSHSAIASANVSWLSRLFDTTDFPQRWNCGTWSSLHGWTHIIADLAIFLAYFTIPVILILFIRKRPNLPFPRIFWLFAAFILTCGTIHLIEATIFWQPWYRLSAAVKVVTALASWATVIALIPTLPKALALPGLADLNKNLQVEIEARRQAEDQLRMVIEWMPNAMVMIDNQRRIQLINRHTSELFGYSSDALLGETIEKLVPERFRPDHPAKVEHFFMDPTPQYIGAGRDFFGRHRDGSEFPIEIGLNPLPSNAGNPPNVLAAVIDITERKRSEQELRKHAAALERKNEELDQFTSFASHDLQEPLRKMISFSELLIQDAGDALPDTAKQDLGFISDAALRMRTLVQDLLLFSRSGRSDLKRAPVSLNQCIESAMSELYTRIEESDAVIEYDNLPSVHADTTLITQLFQNLIGNAIKYRSPDHRPMIRITATHESGKTLVCVQDNGIGVEMNFAERIFEPFKRIHGRDEYEGSGIGLAICRKIVERHDGRIWVEPAPDIGSIFKFTLGDERTRANDASMSAE